MTPAIPGLDPDSLRADLADLLDEPAEEIGDDDDLRDLGLDSIRLMSLIALWRGRGARVEFAELAETEPTVRAWSAYLTAG
ncbi:phosphopantetheine-binding protein [Kitasatospora sp. NPDC088346]|uniref:phosphopantetheine-binding protein n=1 Tax=Kitasatospora sp. NPDC088346 TaxID=3364073 RepID=UPI00380E188F